MKLLIKKVLAAILAATIILTALAGCASSSPEEIPDETPPPTEITEPAEAPEELIPPVSESFEEDTPAAPEEPLLGLWEMVDENGLKSTIELKEDGTFIVTGIATESAATDMHGNVYGETTYSTVSAEGKYVATVDEITLTFNNDGEEETQIFAYELIDEKLYITDEYETVIFTKTSSIPLPASTTNAPEETTSNQPTATVPVQTTTTPPSTTLQPTTTTKLDTTTAPPITTTQPEIIPAPLPPLAQQSYDPATRAAEALKNGAATSIKEVLGLSLAAAMQFGDAALQTFPRSNTEWRPRIMAYQNGVGNTALTTQMQTAFKDLADKFMAETGYGPRTKTHAALTAEVYSWMLSNPQHFLGTDSWWTATGFPDFKNTSMPLYNLPNPWKSGAVTEGNCNILVNWQVGILRELGVYALNFGGYLIAGSAPGGHHVVGVYDPDGKRWLMYDFQNEGVVLGRQAIYDNVFDLYARTNFILTTFVDTANNIQDDWPVAHESAIDQWLHGRYGSGTIIIDGWELSGPVGKIIDLPFNLGEGSQLWQNWQSHTRNLIAPARMKFDPNKNLTRKEFVAMLVQYVRQPVYQAHTNYFTDVPANDPLAFHLSLAGQMGWIDGKTLRPNDRITRSEAAAILSKAAGWLIDQGVPASNPIDSSNPGNPVTKVDAVVFITSLLD
ncbi:MAG: hypothetical protein FWE74_05790 [Oscillospiraceae bacterium]|nr:hypothetical protein [Oscillospiraceae bacterium]